MLIEALYNSVDFSKNFHDAMECVSRNVKAISTVAKYAAKIPKKVCMPWKSSITLMSEIALQGVPVLHRMFQVEEPL